MKIISETPRLIIRTFTADDVKLIYDLCKDPEVVKYLGEEPLTSKEQAHEVLNRKIIENQYNKYGFGRWAVHLKKNGTFIGWCGLKNEDGEIDLGYRFKKKFWGKGYATEAAKAVLDYGFETLKLEKIHAKAMEENRASLAVMQNSGMRYAGKQEFHTHPGIRYEITADEWRRSQSKE